MDKKILLYEWLYAVNTAFKNKNIQNEYINSTVKKPISEIETIIIGRGPHYYGWPVYIVNNYGHISKVENKKCNSSIPDKKELKVKEKSLLKYALGGILLSSLGTYLFANYVK